MSSQLWPSLDDATRNKLIAGVWVAAVIGVIAFSFTAMGGSGQPAEAETTGDADKNDTNGVPVNATAPPASFTTVNGSTLNLDQFSSDPVMLWLPATSCSTCQDQVRTLAENKTRVSNLTIIVLLPQGSSDEVESYARTNAPATLNESNWYWGTATSKIESTYNPQDSHGFTYLIDTNGTVVAKGSQPASSIQVLEGFANHPTMMTD